jgi:hypothetical protein
VLVYNAPDPGRLGAVERLDSVRLLPVYAVNVATPVALMGRLVRRTAHSRGADCSTKAARALRRRG